MLIYIFSLQRQLEAVVRKEYVNKHEDSVKCAFGPLQTSVPPAFPAFDNYNVSKQPKWKKLLDNLIIPQRKRSTWNDYYHLVARYIIRKFADREPKSNVSSQDPIRMLEIGTAFGGQPIVLQRSIPRLEMFVVDPFLPNYDNSDGQSKKMASWVRSMKLGTKEFSKLWSEALAYDNYMRYGCRYHIYAMKSTELAPHFAEVKPFGNTFNPASAKKLDVLFIDGLHTYQGTKDDFDGFINYVRRPGGVVIFNDCQRCFKYTSNE
jgi:hypothetical protein